MPSYIRTRSEFTVNSFTAEGQTSPTVATFADGGFLVVWGTGDKTQDGDESAIKAQLFDSAGRKVGLEFLVNSSAAGSQWGPVVDTLPDGRFVISWVSYQGESGTYEIKAQMFGRDGSHIGGEFQVDSVGDTSGVFEPRVTGLADGKFLISWDERGDVKAQMFDPDGARIGGIVNLNTTAAHGYGDVIALASGGFVATWRATGYDWDVRAQIFDASGAKVGGEFLTHSSTSNTQNTPGGTALAGGGFVIVWVDIDGLGDERVKAQIYTESGQKAGGELLVSTQIPYYMGGPVVTALPDGGFIVAWNSGYVANGNESQIKAQQFTAAGTRVDGEFQINATAPGVQWLPDLATLADGRVVAVWSSATGDVSGGAIRAQILGTELAAPLPNTAPVIISNGAGSIASIIHDERSTAVTLVVASDDGEPNNLRYSIAGADSALFTINAVTGALVFRQAPDHEAPLDQGQDNLYNVTVRATDGTLSSVQSLEIYVRHLNEVTIVSDGGYDYAGVSMLENQTGVTTVGAIDTDGLAITYSITGGDDSSFFTIDAQTGALSFTVAPDYESDEGQYRRNVYYVEVTASDGTVSDSQDIAVYVEDDVNEPLGFAITSNGGERDAEIEVEENNLAVTTVTTQGAAGEVVYEIVGGRDAYSFTIDASTGELSFVEAPDYEGRDGGYNPYYPPYYGYDNQYHVIVRASDGASSDEQELFIIVSDVDEAPIFEYFGGAAHVDFSMLENGVNVIDVVAWDPDPRDWVTYGLEGADAALFETDPYYGGLTLKQPLDFEAPIDADGDNVYEVTVVAYSGELSATQSFSIAVENDWEYVDIVSDGGGYSENVMVAENGTLVTTVRATGDGPVHYEILGGIDSHWFNIDPETGVLSFNRPANYETTGKERDHQHAESHATTYYVVVGASNGFSWDEQFLAVRVQDVDEAPVLLSFGGESYVSLSRFENSAAVATVQARDPDRGSRVTYEIAGGSDASLFQVDSYGQLSFRQSPDFEAPADADGDNVYDVTVSATSGTFSVTQGFSIEIGDVDENVEITSDGGGDDAGLSVAENGTAVTDVDSASALPAAYSIVGGADAGFFSIDASTGALAFTSAPDFEEAVDFDGDNVFEVTVRADNGVAFDDQHLSVQLTDVDEVPYFFDRKPSVDSDVAENVEFVGVMAAVDADGGPAITYAITGGDDAEFFVVDPSSGALSFRGDRRPDFEAPADSDSDNVYLVQITASQGSWSSAKSFTVTVGNENEAPRITSNGGGTSAGVQIDEGQRAVTTMTSVDDGPDPVTYSITGGWSAELFAIDPATGALSFIAAPDHEAPFGESNNFYTVEVTASDGLLSSSQSVQILVRDVEEGVTITSGPAFSMDEESGFVARVAAVDGDGDPVIYSIVGGADASRFVIDPATGNLTAATLLDFEAPVDSDGDNVYEVVVRASDGQLSDERQMSITVDDVDDDLEIVSHGGADLVSLTMQEIGLHVTDVEANFSVFYGVTFSIAGGADAALFTVDRNSGKLSFNYPFVPDFEAPGDSDGDNVYDVVVVANRLTTSDSQAFAITITNRNEYLSITSPGGWQPTLSVKEGESLVTTVVAEDRDGDVPAYSIVGGADAALFAIDPATGALTFIAAPDHEAPRSAAGSNLYIVEVGATDGEYLTTQTIRIAVGNVDEAVAITSLGGGASAALTVGENGLTVTTVTASDPERAILTYSIAGGADAARFAIDSRTGALRFVQAPNFEAPADAGGDNVYDVVVSVTDGAFTDSQALAVTVANVGEGVAFTSFDGADIVIRDLAENGPGAWSVAAADGDGDPVSYSLSGDDAGFFAIDPDGKLRFVGTPDFEAPADSDRNNTYMVTVVASAGTSSDTQIFGIGILDTDEAVAITSNGGGSSAAVSAAENGTAVATVSARDPDGRPVTYAIAGGADASRFTIDAATGVLAFVSAPNFEAAADSGANNVYDVIVSASDGSFTDTQAIAVTVTNVNEAPVITSAGGGAGGSVSVAENGLAAGIVAAADPDGTSASYSIVGGADAARFTINAQTGALSFVAAPDWELPADSDKDNVYAVVVRASDGQLFDEQALSVTVTNTRDGNNVTGTSGGDSISATSTNAALRTSNEEDLVFGRDGHDTIQGMAGDDELYGEGGNDVLVGGDGADKLLGGLGKDQFTYNALSESTVFARDTIMDFNRGQGDRIALSAIDANSLASNNQAFTFIGTSAFSNVAGQLRYETWGGVTTIAGDVNGDGVADLVIQLSGSVPLTASDFIL
jgi:Ca2+-binding RTX toxin-like protein